jgi:hypothetical protein
MNNLTKQRYISTSIWSDDWFDSLSEREKLVYFYLLTNEHTNPAGVYQCTLKNVRLEIGLDREEIERIMGKFGDAGKAFYFMDYIIIPKWLKHQKIKERSGLFLGACRVLKSLPEEVKEFISDRSHYDYDISDIIVKRPSQDPPPKKGRPSKEGVDTIPKEKKEPPHEKNGGSIEPPTQTTAKRPHELDSDLDRDIDSELDIDMRENVNEVQPLQEHFIKRWQQNPTVFNCLARLKQPKEWQAFWENNNFTQKEIDTAIDNFIDGVRTGAIERRFIPASPDGFVINGWIVRSQTPFRPQQSKGGHRIANDNVSDDDTSTYFTEA